MSIDVNSLTNEELVDLERSLQVEERDEKSHNDRLEAAREADPDDLKSLRMLSDSWTRLADIARTLTDIHIRLIIRGVRSQGDSPPSHV